MEEREGRVLKSKEGKVETVMERKGEEKFALQDFRAKHRRVS